jgi:putative transposase
MPWMETCAMSERAMFVGLAKTGMYTVAELCERFRVSRPTGYKWLQRFEEEGPPGLEDRSRRPLTSPTKTPDEIEALIVALREKFGWGPKKLVDLLRRRHPEVKRPSVSTCGAILDRHGLTKKHRRVRKHRHPGRPSRPANRPNELWTTDFKGEFWTGDGVYCYPLTVADQHSRYLLAVQGLPSVKGVGVRPVFERLFREHGLPDAIRSDNGSPFVTRAICGLSMLNVWWMQLGIVHERIEPGCPNQNGRHERMHWTLKEKTAMPPEDDAPSQQKAFDEFITTFNTIRPHEALDNKTPAEVWRPSTRPYPEKIKPPEYPGHFLVRKVSNAGNFKYHDDQLFLSHTLAQEYVGLEEIDDGVWSIYYYDFLLGRMDERELKIYG